MGVFTAILAGAASAGRAQDDGRACQNSNRLAFVRHLCFLPRKRVWRVFLEKHLKILPLLRSQGLNRL